MIESKATRSITQKYIDLGTAIAKDRTDGKLTRNEFKAEMGRLHEEHTEELRKAGVIAEAETAEQGKVRFCSNDDSSDYFGLNQCKTRIQDAYRMVDHLHRNKDGDFSDYKPSIALQTGREAKMSYLATHSDLHKRLVFPFLQVAMDEALSVYLHALAEAGFDSIDDFESVNQAETYSV